MFNGLSTGGTSSSSREEITTDVPLFSSFLLAIEVISLSFSFWIKEVILTPFPAPEASVPSFLRRREV